MRRSWIVSAVLAALLCFAGSAAALPADKHLTLEADDGQGCASEGKNDCYHVAEGSLDGFEQGMRVHVELVNVGSADHNVYVAEPGDADGNNIDSSGDAAINGSDTIASGESTNLTFTVPAEADGLYFWCDVTGHEALGMWLETDVAEADNATDDGSDTPEDDGGGDEADDGTDGDEEDDDVSRFLPAPGPVAALVAALGAALFLRRRS